MRKYPKVGGILSKKKNRSAKCRCGAVATHKTTVQVNIFRGDDEVLWCCDEHKNDCAFLIGARVGS